MESTYTFFTMWGYICPLQINDTSTWRKPILLFGDQDIETIASTYTDEEAAIFIQNAWRRLQARKRVARIAQAIIMKVQEDLTYSNFTLGIAKQH